MSKPNIIKRKNKKKGGRRYNKITRGQSSWEH